MKFKWLFLLILISLISTSCSARIQNNEVTANTAKFTESVLVDTTSQGGTISQTETEADSSKQEIISGEYYRVAPLNIGKYRYDIYDEDKNIIDFGILSGSFPEFVMLNDEVLKLKKGGGSSVFWCQYYNLKKSIISPKWSYVWCDDGVNNLVAYQLDRRRLCIQDIFNKENYYKIIERDFSEVAVPVLEAEILDNGKSLNITYLKGDDMSETSELIPLL